MNGSMTNEDGDDNSRPRGDFGAFESASIKTDETEIFVRYAGRGPGILVLHGFPQTHLMWRVVAPAFATTFSVVCADLRGYGASGKPTSTSDHAPYAKRAMAQDMVQVMRALGFAVSRLSATTEAGVWHTGWRWTTRTR